MANTNRPVIGHVTCNICNGRATVHQVARGSRTGALYIRGCECGINQSPGEPLQKYWRENVELVPDAKLVPGTESMFGEPIGETAEDQGNTTEPAPELGSAGEPVQSDEQGGSVVVAGGLLAAVVLGGLALLGMKR